MGFNKTYSIKAKNAKEKKEIDITHLYQAGLISMIQTIL